jgi:hypothetical protein
MCALLLLLVLQVCCHTCAWARSLLRLLLQQQQLQLHACAVAAACVRPHLCFGSIFAAASSSDKKALTSARQRARMWLRTW